MIGKLGGGRPPHVPGTAQTRHFFGEAGPARRWRAPMRAGSAPEDLSTPVPSRRRPRSAAHVGGADPICCRAPYVPCTAQKRHVFGEAGPARRWRAPMRAGTVPNGISTPLPSRGRPRSATHGGGDAPWRVSTRRAQETGRFPPGPEPARHAARDCRPAAAVGPLGRLGPMRSPGCASGGPFRTVGAPAHVTVQRTGRAWLFFGVAATAGLHRGNRPSRAVQLPLGYY